MIAAPPGFVQVEQTTVLHRPPADPGAVRRAKGSEPPPRPSIVIVKRRGAADAAPLATRMCDELLRVVPGARVPADEEFEFDDGGAGRLVALTFDVMPALTARQWIAVRCDAEWSVTATYTAPIALANEDEARAALRTLRIA